MLGFGVSNSVNVYRTRRRVNSNSYYFQLLTLT